MKKTRKVIFITLIAILLIIPIPLNGNGRYEAILWGRRRDRVVVEQNIGGIEGRVKYYNVYKYRIIFLPITIEDKSHIYSAQW